LILSSRDGSWAYAPSVDWDSFWVAVGGGVGAAFGAVIAWLQTWGALFIPLVGILITWVLVPKPYFRNESYLDTSSGRSWNVRLVNRGKGEASNVTLIIWVRNAKPKRNRAGLRAGTWEVRVRGEAAGANFPLAPDADLRRFKAVLTWEMHPLPWWTHKKTIRAKEGVISYSELEARSQRFIY